MKGLRKARRMWKEGESKPEIRKYLSTLKKKNIFLGTYEPLTKEDINNFLVILKDTK